MSTFKQKFNKKFNQPLNQSNSKADITKLTGIPKSVLDDVYDRGIGAYKTSPASVRTKSGKKDPKAPMSAKMSKEQWAMSRVYAFVMKSYGGMKTTKKQDLDLYEKIKSKLK